MSATTFTLPAGVRAGARVTTLPPASDAGRPSFSQQLARLPLPDLHRAGSGSACVTLGARRTTHLHDGAL